MVRTGICHTAMEAQRGPMTKETTIQGSISPGVLWQVGAPKMHQGVMMLSILRESTFVHGIEESYNFQVSHFCHIWKSIHVVFIYVIYRLSRKTCLSA